MIRNGVDMVYQMAVVNLTPDSFYEPSRVWSDKPDAALARIRRFLDEGADIIDLGAVSTRPGAADVPVEEEWRRLEPVLEALVAAGELPTISIDTTSAEIVRRAFELIGKFIVNDISAGEDDKTMLQTVGQLGLTYVAMHKRGNPRSMDSLCEYPDGIIPELVRYFKVFSRAADSYGIKGWILDPGLGFAKTEEQNWEILEKLEALRVFGRPILIGAADKRFTHGDTARAHALAIAHGADILRVHTII